MSAADGEQLKNSWLISEKHEKSYQSGSGFRFISMSNSKQLKSIPEFVTCGFVFQIQVKQFRDPFDIVDNIIPVHMQCCTGICSAVTIHQIAHQNREKTAVMFIIICCDIPYHMDRTVCKDFMRNQKAAEDNEVKQIVIGIDMFADCS